MSVRCEAANSEYLSRSIVGAQDLVYAGWFYLHALPGAGGRAPIVSAYSTDFTGFEVGVNESGVVYIWGANGDDTVVNEVDPATISADTMYYLWVVYDHSETEAHVYLDFSETAEVSHTGLSLGNSSPTLNLGSNVDNYRTDEYADCSLVGWKAWAGGSFLAASNATAESASCVMVTTTNAYAEWPLPDQTDIADQRNSNDLTANGTLSAGASDPGGYSCGESGTAVEAGTATLTLTGQTPTISVGANVYVTPGTASLSLTGQTPTIATGANVNVEAGTAALSLTGYRPVIEVVSDPGDPVLIEAGTAALSITTYAPTVSYTENIFVEAGTATLTLTGGTPTVAFGQDVVVTPGTASLSITASAPTVTYGENIYVVPGTAALTLTTYPPTVVAEGVLSVIPGTAVLSLTGQTPNVSAPFTVTPGTANLTLTASTPTVNVGASVFLEAGTAALVLTGQTPTISLGAIAAAARDILPKSGDYNILGSN